MTMAERVLTDPYEVADILARLRLTRDGLVDAVMYAERERSFCTSFDAPGFAAMTVYDKAARRLRENFCGEAWAKDDSDNQAAIRNDELGVRVVPCNFDYNAGNRLIQPTNRSPKGEVSRTKTTCNATGWLPHLPQVSAQTHLTHKTWVLGIYAVQDEPLRAELSFPLGFDGKQFTHFSPRVILLDGSEGLEPAERLRPSAEGPTEDIDISIRRRM